MSDLENLVHNAFAEMHYPNAAAELIQLRKDLEVACHVKAKDKVGFDFAVLEEIAICQGVILSLRKDVEMERKYRTCRSKILPARGEAK